MSLDVIGNGFEVDTQAEIPASINEALNTRTQLTLVEVNQVLEGTGWVATILRNGVYDGELGESGFELVQGQFDEDGDLLATTDSLPVLSAWQIGNRVRFVLKSADRNGSAKIHLDELVS
ncbi:hypothetical protein GW756_00590 [bacterium]|nr:hypothetical protein [bacterium]NCQ54856.1 hypothetical protein [Candidatus Parcubacteria bacterium]NCS66900.1 hypothetical protein [Candidatus Peregrinibacteria bacterium]NCS95846.1 hypothetical protein [bacterium]